MEGEAGADGGVDIVTLEQTMTPARIKGFRTSVPICAQCRKWNGRLPIWDEYLDKGDCCTRCGGTSFHWKECRPFGPKSKEWARWLEDYETYSALYEVGSYGWNELEEAVIR